MRATIPSSHPRSRSLYQALTAGGGKADFEQPTHFDEEGHHLFFGVRGSEIWGPMVLRYLSQRLPASG
jgi:hypothetical protein